MCKLGYLNIIKVMYKLLIVLFTLLVGSFQDKSIAVNLTVMRDIDNPLSVSKTISIYPAVFSSPVNNLDQVFTIVKADPIDACTRISIPTYDEQISQGLLVVIDYEKGTCGIRRRIQMAKDVGAKGVIFLTDTDEHSFTPYGDFSDLTFLVFIAAPKEADPLIIPNQYIVARLFSVQKKQADGQKSDLELWVAPLDTKSYELLLIWKTTMEEIPSISTKVKWRPRYALWGCNSGLFQSESDCLNMQYRSTCACRGQFCSPETKYAASGAIVKQDIRQKYIFLNFPDKYLAYIKEFSEKCLKTFQTSLYVEDCVANVLITANITESKVRTAVQNFQQDCGGDIYEKLLLDRNRFTEIGTYPGAFLDRSPIDFKTKRDFQVQLCRKLGLQKQPGCTKVLRTNTVYTITINILFYLCIIVGLVVIVAGLVLLYRKTIKKWMHKEMKMQVAASVEHYFALSETK